MKCKILLLVAIFIGLQTNAQSGSITLNAVQQRTDGSGFVDIYFNLSGLGSTYNIDIEVSFNGGSTYTDVPANYLSGDVNSISSGSNKHIVWDGLGSFPATYSTQAKLKLIADVSISGTPCPGMATYTDPRDGQTYNTVQIGDQCWIKEDLKYLPSVSGPDTGSTSNPHYYVCGYHGTDIQAAKATANYQNYGVLYNWPAAMTACPPGWHLPSQDEWTQLINYVVSQGFSNSWTNPNGAGNALKSCRQIGSSAGIQCNSSEHPRWEANITHQGIDAFGFSMLPIGYRGQFGSFTNVGELGFWWSSTEGYSPNAGARRLNFNQGGVYSSSNRNKAIGDGVRCIMD